MRTTRSFVVRFFRKVCVVEFFVKGAVLGFLIAAPVGPIGLLCIYRTLRAGWFTGLLTGFGAATADAAYASVAAFGIRAVAAAIGAVTIPLHVGGAVFLGWMGVHMLRSNADRHAAAGVLKPRAFAAFVSTVMLTLANPATIVSFIAVFAAAATRAPSVAGAVVIVAGVLCGSTAWWLVLSTVVALWRRALSARALRAIDAASAALLIGFAAYVLGCICYAEIYDSQSLHC
jgi:threonine/homoserine/homoserine lactone efflux protein